MFIKASTHHSQTHTHTHTFTRVHPHTHTYFSKYNLSSHPRISKMKRGKNSMGNISNISSSAGLWCQHIIAGALWAELINYSEGSFVFATQSRLYSRSNSTYLWPLSLASLSACTYSFSPGFSCMALAVKRDNIMGRAECVKDEFFQDNNWAQFGQWPWGSA